MYHNRINWMALSALALLSLVLLSGCAAQTYASSSQQSNAQIEVVREFYEWYSANAGYQPETGEMRNPMVERSYHDAPGLSERFIAQLDEDLSAGPITHDPFACAQDIPTGFIFGEVNFSPMGEEARVPVTTNFPNHQFEVYLQHVDGQWVIDGIICIPLGVEPETPPTD